MLGRNITFMSWYFIRRLFIVTKSIADHFPTATEDPRPFLSKNKDFVTEILKKEDLSAEVAKYCPSGCPLCSEPLKKMDSQD